LETYSSLKGKGPACNSDNKVVLCDMLIVTKQKGGVGNHGNDFEERVFRSTRN
jgi:hypothetical protein